ncbi:anti-sigma factor [Sporosarcina sp. ANT_H38]|uniref:anti-sigma factor n=1 Tax=Sporosarcina sp. ANT_H38 TaxID=2597358 RepID=UPI0011F13AA6|nr:anti-sigma factor [Sporosarcina sp. ANT_H38]KAA0965749.1 anti-sigma factor [Sporosarcina sp. ANT_H38]
MKDDNRNDHEERYNDFLNRAIQDFNASHTISYNDQQQIIKKGRNTATKKNIMVSLAILLLIVPVMTLGTYLYYATGGKANNLIEVGTSTIYVTEPNMSLEPMRINTDIGFFSMNMMFDIYKKIGRENYKVGDYDVYFAFDKPAFSEKNLVLERPLPEIPSKETESLIHPKVPIPAALYSQWAILNGLPEGTVAEVHVSMSEIMTPKELEELLGQDIEIRWLAVDTGLEQRQVDQEGVPITPLGYPAQVDHTTWSPFNGEDKTNAQVFMEMLTFLEKNEAVAEKIARAKSLALKERISYINDNGIRIYAATVTGSTSELRDMEGNNKVRAIKVGEVKLWN